MSTRPSPTDGRATAAVRLSTAGGARYRRTGSTIPPRPGAGRPSAPRARATSPVRRAAARQRGATLIELVVAIVIISIAVTSVILGTSQITRHSADPMIYAQAQAIAEAYLEEILLKDFSCGGGSEGGETRATYDDVDDYHAPAYAAVSDQEGNAVGELAAYEISVAVECAALNGIGSTDAARIEVRVHNLGFNPDDVAVLVGYRTRI